MSNNIVPPIETLPVELFHRICDDLDAQTILYSLAEIFRGGLPRVEIVGFKNFRIRIPSIQLFCTQTESID